MIDTSPSGMAYNRFVNLDGVEDRIIYYLLCDKYDLKNNIVKEVNGKIRYVDNNGKIEIDPTNIITRPVTLEDKKAQEQVQIIRRILMYNDVDALLNDESHPDVTFKQVSKLIYNNNDKQNNFRVFRSPRLESSFNEECSLLKIYIDSIIPDNRNIAIVNMGIDAVVNTRIINIRTPDIEDDLTIPELQRKIGVPLYLDEEDTPVPIEYKSRVSVLTKAILYLLNGADIAGVGKALFSRENSIFNQAQYGIWNNRNFEGMKIVIGVSMSGVS